MSLCVSSLSSRQWKHEKDLYHASGRRPLAFNAPERKLAEHALLQRCDVIAACMRKLLIAARPNAREDMTVAMIFFSEMAVSPRRKPSFYLERRLPNSVVNQRDHWTAAACHSRWDLSNDVTRTGLHSDGLRQLVSRSL
jgi:hypothetical protein